MHSLRSLHMARMFACCSFRHPSLYIPSHSLAAMSITNPLYFYPLYSLAARFVDHSTIWPGSNKMSCPLQLTAVLASNYRCNFQGTPVGSQAAAFVLLFPGPMQARRLRHRRQNYNRVIGPGTNSTACRARAADLDRAFEHY